MKTTKRIFLTTLALLLVTAVSLSAGEERWAKLKQELNLTDSQVTQLEQKFETLQPLMEKGKALKSELKALESAATPDQKAIGAKKAELDVLHKEWKEKATPIYRSVLTQEQFAKLQEMDAKHEKEHSTKK